jgi:hypothetical protein
MFSDSVFLHWRSVWCPSCRRLNHTVPSPFHHVHHSFVIVCFPRTEVPQVQDRSLQLTASHSTQVCRRCSKTCSLNEMLCISHKQMLCTVNGGKLKS